MGYQAISVFTLLTQVISIHEYKEQRKDQPNSVLQFPTMGVAITGARLLVCWNYY